MIYHRTLPDSNIIISVGGQLNTDSTILVLENDQFLTPYKIDSDKKEAIIDLLDQIGRYNSFIDQIVFEKLDALLPFPIKDELRTFEYNPPKYDVIIKASNENTQMAVIYSPSLKSTAMCIISHATKDLSYLIVYVPQALRSELVQLVGSLNQFGPSNDKLLIQKISFLLTFESDRLSHKFHELGIDGTNLIPEI